MYNLTIQMLEHIAETLQIGKRSPNQEVRIFKKLKNGNFDKMPYRLKEVESISVDARWNMAADEAMIHLSNTHSMYSPDYLHLKTFRGVDEMPISPFHNVIVPFNRIEVDLGYGDQLVRKYTGQIQPVQISDTDQTIAFTCKNEFRKLLKPIDPITHRQLVYKKKRATDILIDLFERAGVENYIVNVSEIGDKDFEIAEFVIELGTSYKDAVNKILEVMGHRIFANRFGFVEVKELERYNQKNSHHWEFSDYVDLSQGGYDLDPSIFRNRIIVQGKSQWKAFEDPWLIDYCNGERIAMGIEVPWAETDEHMQFAADNFFIQMRRKLRRVTIATIGNPSIDIGDLAKLELFHSTAKGKYMIVGVSSKFSDSGYIDLIDLEYATDSAHIAVPAEGEYKPMKKVIDPDGEHEEPEDPTETEIPIRDKIIATAKRWRGTYYQWGGDRCENADHYGFDCSHFVYEVLKEQKLIEEYETAEGLRTWADEIDRDDLQPGDLIFYMNKDGQAIHVTIYLGNGTAIGASGGDADTTSIGKARQKNAKVKVSNAFYGTMEYGRIPTL